MKKCLFILIAMLFVVSCSDDDKAEPLYKGSAAPASLSTENIENFALQHCGTGDNPLGSFQYAGAGSFGDCANPGDVNFSETASSFSVQFVNACTMVNQNEILVNGALTASGNDTTANIAMNLSVVGGGEDFTIQASMSAIFNDSTGDASITFNMTIADNTRDKQVKFENFKISVNLFDAENILGDSINGTVDPSFIAFDSGRVYYSDFGYVDFSSENGNLIFTGADGARVEQSISGATFYASADDQTGQAISCN